MKPKRGRTNQFRVRIVFGKKGSFTITSPRGDEEGFPPLTRIEVAEELENMAAQIRKYEPRYLEYDAKAAESAS